MNKALEVNEHIIAMHRYMMDVTLAQNTEELELAVSLVGKEEAEAFKHFDFIMERFLGDKSRIEKARQLFADWKPIRSEVIELTRGGRNDEAALLTKGKGTSYVASLTKEMDGLAKFAQNKAATFLLESIEKQNKSKMYLYEFMAAIFVIGLFVSYLVIRKINQSSKELMQSEERWQFTLEGNQDETN